MKATRNIVGPPEDCVTSRDVTDETCSRWKSMDGFGVGPEPRCVRPMKRVISMTGATLDGNYQTQFLKILHLDISLPQRADRLKAHMLCTLFAD